MPSPGTGRASQLHTAATTTVDGGFRLSSVARREWLWSQSREQR
jgi:hypothetical protein